MIGCQEEEQTPQRAEGPEVPRPLGRPQLQHTVLVVGLGNHALRDEGIGIHAVRALARQDLPPGVRLLEGATRGWGLVGEMEGVRRLVLVDAMRMRRPPGTVVTARRQDLRRLFPPDRASLHGTSVLDALDLAAALGVEPPEVYIVGVQPAEVTWGLDLSPLLQKVLPEVVEAVLRAIGQPEPVQPGTECGPETKGRSR